MTGCGTGNTIIMVKNLHESFQGYRVYVFFACDAHFLLLSANQKQNDQRIQRGIYSITRTYLRSMKGNCSLKMSIPTNLGLFIEPKNSLQ